ncbi:hypothetical protein [Paraburkholderia caffeinilytica]|uniref:hypothetical protein n=1 Tax=Paraburkholderia caffeinilytica TaxID=1761016 RepID=UPI0013BE8C68|nr:hypothetical protein [Paraburkholderia caffeinilytica]
MNVRIAVILSITIQTPVGEIKGAFLPLAVAVFVVFVLFVLLGLVSFVDLGFGCVCLRRWAFLVLMVLPFLELIACATRSCPCAYGVGLSLNC